MSKRRHNFGTKRFKEKSLFIFHARIALKSLILLFVCLIARGARIGKTHTQTHRHTDRTSTVTLAHVRRGLIIAIEASFLVRSMARIFAIYRSVNVLNVSTCIEISAQCDIPQCKYTWLNELVQ